MENQRPDQVNAAGNNSTKGILLVEDDPSNAEMLSLLLQSETPYRILTLPSGDEVLRSIDEVKSFQPALFLFDYHLPKMNGLELYDQLHTTEGLEHVPALFTSAALLEGISDEISGRGLKLLYKPFELDEFLQAVRDAMH
ncbi:response regulator [Ktedonosporobacter rubrisoli]|uniref:Response regulator n=1 Tax=Ktedonosporobacter rubrisoli TaxID=2509675 RepID=A0A4P6JWN5_KTERU|nr:response regulator [Ktedonosporobacter rubrisoli]QBD79994.1 response regulator [Ktedonosporobacter rubrisoli]